MIRELNCEEIYAISGGQDIIDYVANSAGVAGGAAMGYVCAAAKVGMSVTVGAAVAGYLIPTATVYMIYNTYHGDHQLSSSANLGNAYGSNWGY